MFRFLFQPFEHLFQRRLVHGDGVVFHEGMRGRCLRERRDFGFAQLGQARFQAGSLLDAGDPRGELFRPGKARAAAELFQARIRVDADEGIQGEGAGFAGGIVSAAIDGISAARRVLGC